jgi:hypothetical protein
MAHSRWTTASSPKRLPQSTPDLVVKGADGLLETVQYQKLTPMLVNELQKQSVQGRKQGEIIRLQQHQIETMAARLAALEAAISAGRGSVETVAK